MKIFTSAKIRELDRYTIEHEPIQSIDLMERAASTLARTIANTWDSSVKVVVLPALATTAVMRLPWHDSSASKVIKWLFSSST